MGSPAAEARWRAGRIAAAAVALCLLCGPAHAQTLEPIVTRAQVISNEIYDAAAWAIRVPYSLAFPIVARARLGAYLDGLPLDPAVRARVDARVRAPVFVDEIVPFLIAVQELYTVSGEEPAARFDAHLRARFSPADTIPGMQHGMFHWRPDEDAAASGFELDAPTAADLVRAYDALYLRGRDPEEGPESLACDRQRDEAELRASAARTAPIVRELVKRVSAQMGESDTESEVRDMLDSLASDDERLETATLALVEFSDLMICKYYRIFATRVIREQQLRDWMQAELAEPGGGDLWAWLEHAARQRRYAVLVVVDGLQGHLVEALAGGVPDAFMKQVAREHRNPDALAPASQHSAPLPAPRLEFLTRFAERGYAHPDYLPFFRRLYADPRGIARVGVATSPTISVRNLPIAKTGAPVAGPGGTGIPNFHFVDRQYARNGEPSGRAYYFFGNDALRLAELTRQSGMRSLFDRLPTLGSFSCASQYDEAAHFSIDAFVTLGLGEAIRDFAEVLCIAELQERAANEQKLSQLRAALLAKREAVTEELAWYRFYRRSGQRDERILAHRLIATIAGLQQETLPELFVYYNPWPDHFAHFTGPFADEILAPSGELNRLDYWLGRLAAVYANAGVTERTLFAMAGDHGLAPVFHRLNPEVKVLEALQRPLVVRKISSDEGEGPKLNHRLDPPPMKGIDVVVASTAGGNYMLDWFTDQDEHWAEQPLHAQLEKQRLLGGGDRTLDVIDAIYSRLDQSLDYLVVRETACSERGGVVRVIGPRAGKRAEALIERRGERILYRPAGADLLDTGTLSPYESFSTEQRQVHARLHERCVGQAVESDLSSWCNEDEWRLLTSYTPRPDSVGALAHLYDSDRAGTVNLFPAPGIGYNTKVPGRHAGESFHEKDAFVGAWGAPIAAQAGTPRVRSAVNGSMPILVYEWLTGAAVTPGQDGWGYPSLAAELLGLPRTSPTTP